MPRRIAALIAVLLFAAPAARAQDLAAVCRRIMHPPVGAWAEYGVQGGRGEGTTLRMSVVARETLNDTSFLWLEFAARGMPMGLGGAAADTLVVINKVLVPGFGPGMGEPRQHVLKFGSLPAMTMETGRRGPGGSGAPNMQDCGDGKVVGWESVTVPAGTFRALHVQDSEGKGDSWVTPDLPFGIVKAQAADSGYMVLTKHGMGATSQITETPRPYDPKLLMQLLMQGGQRQ